MAKINVSNLHPVGSDLFFDSENYISELSDNELGTINGGFSMSCTVTVTETGAGIGIGILLNQ